jgi:16S rRNA (guanine966-N2)-methyltransferase
LPVHKKKWPLLLISTSQQAFLNEIFIVLFRGMAQQKNEQFEFTIISGSLKNRRITSPDLGVTRPPLSRLRRSIFDFLMPYLDGADYLDLFSGTGSYLFEAVSRGVQNAVGVEREKQLADSINRQAVQLGVEKSLVCIADDVFQVIPKLAQEKRTFDIIMMAPPQYIGLIDQTLVALHKNPLSTSKGIILCQHDTSETHKIKWLDFPIKQQRTYGNTTYTILG